MKREHSNQRTFTEINLHDFLRRVWKYKYLFVLSILFFVGAGIGYLYITPPVYKATSTLLIDANGSSRIFGESQSLNGGVGLIETDKNIYNEMNILKSVALIEKTVKDLDLTTSYYMKDMFKTRELYDQFPFSVKVLEESPLIINVPVFIQPISKDSYRIIIQESEYDIQRDGGIIDQVDGMVTHSAIHKFGEPATSPYYNITLNQIGDHFPADQFVGKELFFTFRTIDEVVNSYQNKLEVLQVDLESSILELVSTGEVAKKEIDFLNKLSLNYIDSKIDERDQIAAGKESFIKQQLESITDSLTKAERSLELFRREANAVNLTQSGTNALEKFQQLQSDQAQAQLNLKYYRSLLEYLQDSSSLNQIIAPSAVGISDPLLNENLLDLKRLTAEQTRMRYLKGPQSYDLEILNRQISNTREVLEENVRNLIASSTLALNDYNSRIQTLERTLDLLPSSEKRLLNYQRQTKLYENLYTYLSQELAKTGIARAEDLPDIETLNHARMDGNGPISPIPFLVLTLFGLVGLTIPAVYVTLKKDENILISGVEELEANTSLPILSQIALDPGMNKDAGETIASSHWQTKESFRDLHANLKFFMPDYWQKITAVTSTVPGEGKTFSALNLAMSMASAGNDVLLIDTDFRNPSLSRSMGVKPSQNLSSYLHGWVEDPNQIIQSHDKYPKLDYITTHAAHSNPHRLIQNPRFEFLILSLKDEYDHIILDCPAVGLVSDYLLLSHLADIHMFVMKQDVSQISYIENIEKLKVKGNLENLFLVLNGVPGKDLKHGYFSYDSNIRQQAPKKSAIRRALSA